MEKPPGQCSVVGSSFEELGYELLPDVASEAVCDLLTSELSSLYETRQDKSVSQIGGIRNLLKIPLVAELASSSKIRMMLEERLHKPAFPVRAIFFDKTPEANWRVQWHQDLTIAVAECRETPGFSGWSLKDGVHHVQPPVEILDEMATLRLHLDDCTEENGALKVISGSHRNGRIASSVIPDYVGRESVFVCASPRGSALLMRPLLLHSSSPATVPSHRRILHIEYATGDLPNGLCWHYRP